MTEKLIDCPRCESNACTEMSTEKLTIWNCFGCGFTTNSTLKDSTIAEVEKFLPELYVALKFKDKQDKYWYPLAITMDDKAMVFAEGTTTEDWKWSAVQSKDGKADMTTKQEFVEREFMDALEYVGYFNKK